MYSTTSEYRRFLRQICSMEPGKLYSDQDYAPEPLEKVLTDPSEKVLTDPLENADKEVEPLDEETLDEFTYDQDAMTRFLDRVYAASNNNLWFQTLYINAAALMFSENLEIGLAVLCSYDYLADFYACFQKFESDPKLFGSNFPPNSILPPVEEYVRLYKTLTKSKSK
jgi:hypothetical protein